WEDCDAFIEVARDDVPRSRRCAADGVALAGNDDSRAPRVGAGGHAVGTQTDIASLHHIAAIHWLEGAAGLAPEDYGFPIRSEAIQTGTVDRKPAKRAGAGEDVELPDDFHDRSAGIARLRSGIDDDRVVDGETQSRNRDRERPGTRNIESDAV